MCSPVPQDMEVGAAVDGDARTVEVGATGNPEASEGDRKITKITALPKEGKKTKESKKGKKKKDEDADEKSAASKEKGNVSIIWTK